MKSYKDFEAWKQAMELVKNIYNASSQFPMQEQFGLTSQMRRSAVSIPSNFAEGFGRHGDKEFARFLNIAVGSLYELQTQIEISFSLDFINEKSRAILIEKSILIEKLIKGLLRKLK